MDSLTDLRVDFGEEKDDPIYAEVRPRRSQGNVMFVHPPPAKVTNGFVPSYYEPPVPTMNPGFAVGYNETLGVWSGGLKSHLEANKRSKHKNIPRLMRSRDNGFLTLPIGLDPRAMLPGTMTLSGPPSIRAESLPPGPSSLPPIGPYSIQPGVHHPMGYRTLPLQRPFTLPPPMTLSPVHPHMTLPRMQPQVSLMPIEPAGKMKPRRSVRRMTLPDGRINPCYLALLILIGTLLAASIVGAIMLVELHG